jgi:hypothetical protein
MAFLAAEPFNGYLLYSECLWANKLKQLKLQVIVCLITNAFSKSKGMMFIAQ